MTNSGISIDELATRLGSPNWPVILDVRIPEDIDADPAAIPCSVFHPFDRMAELRPLPDADIVVVCQKGLKLSQGAAAQLRCKGLKARHLIGGQLGWLAAHLPVTKLRQQGQRWVLPRNPEPQVLLALWLVRRFVDAEPSFLVVEADQVATVADRFDGQPICKADAARQLLADQGLKGPTLLRLADVMDRAVPSEIGEVLRGLAGIYEDELKLIDAAAPVFDGTYRALTTATDDV